MKPCRFCGVFRTCNVCDRELQPAPDDAAPVPHSQTYETFKIDNPHLFNAAPEPRACCERAEREVIRAVVKMLRERVRARVDAGVAFLRDAAGSEARAASLELLAVIHDLEREGVRRG